jgi:hypothetical protein
MFSLALCELGQFLVKGTAMRAKSLEKQNLNFFYRSAKKHIKQKYKQKIIKKDTQKYIENHAFLSLICVNNVVMLFNFGSVSTIRIIILGKKRAHELKFCIQDYWIFK